MAVFLPSDICRMVFEEHLGCVHQLDELFRAFSFWQIIFYLLACYIMGRCCFKAIRAAMPYHKMPIADAGIKPHPFFAKLLINIPYNLFCFISSDMVGAEIIHINLAIFL